MGDVTELPKPRLDASQMGRQLVGDLSRMMTIDGHWTYRFEVVIDCSLVDRVQTVDFKELHLVNVSKKDNGSAA